jgi:hypothetical protein
MIFFPLGMVLKQFSLEAASWPIFIVLEKNQKCKKMQKNWVNMQFSNSNCFGTISSRNEKKFLLQVKLPYPYLDRKRPPFPNRLSINAEILRQNGMHTAGCTQTAGRYF